MIIPPPLLGQLFVHTPAELVDGLPTGAHDPVHLEEGHGAVCLAMRTLARILGGEVGEEEGADFIATE